MKRIWTTKQGKKLKIKDMTTQHIKNCIKLLENYHSHILNSLLSYVPLGEMAQITIDNEIDNIVENGFEDEAEDYISVFQEELEKRRKK